MLIAGVCVCHAPRTEGGRWTQIVALGVVILILFPVISVTDDLSAAQSPTEIESYQRKDHVSANTPSAPIATLEFTLPEMAQLSCGILNMRLPDSPVPRISETRLSVFVQNRPPPAAANSPLYS